MAAHGSLFTWMLLIGLSCAALAGACTERTYTRFPHRLHLVELACGKPGRPDCMSCTGCHTPSERDRAHKLPDRSLCARCHQKDMHGVDRVLAVVPERPSGKIEFDHDQHLAMTGIDGQCVPCHAGIVKSEKPSIPPMSQCFTCHEHDAQWKRGECAPCHQMSELTNVLPRTFLRHEGNFMRHHGTLAVQQRALCQSCHTQSECDDCHDANQVFAVERRQPERVERDFVHRGDFMVRHAIEAQSQPSRCLRCHEPENCDTCHLQRGVSGNAANGRNPHPPGWVGTDVGSRNFHGHAARRDITLCASCHEQGPATNCIRCHRVGAFGGNPHPNGWRSARSMDESMCRYCHE